MKIPFPFLLFAVSCVFANDYNGYCSKSAPEGCYERIGLNYYRVSDVVLSASTSYNDAHGPQRSGLFTTLATGLVAAWCPSVNNVQQWIQADFGSPRRVTGVLFQGRGECDCDQWVTSLRVLFSDDGEVWYSTAPIVGGFDRDTVQRRFFDRPIVARYFRLNPISWHNHIALRFDLIGCNSCHV